MTDEPAFPHSEPRDPRLSATRPGLTKREWYAGLALQALVHALVTGQSGPLPDAPIEGEVAAALQAFAFADAMIEAGKVKP